MFKYRLIFFLLIVTGFAAHAQQAHHDSTSAPRRIFTVVEEPPKFPGPDELHSYIKKNLQIPPDTPKRKSKGVIFLTFIVDEKGGIQDIKVMKGLTKELNAEAVRVVQNMPNWIPARQNGHIVAFHYNLSVHL